MEEQITSDLMTAFDRIYSELVDDTLAIKRFSDEIRKRRIGKNPKEATPYELVALHRGTVDKRAARMVAEGQCR